MIKRICPECGIRELDKHQRKCSECVEINILISKDIYAASSQNKLAQKKYFQSDKGRATKSKANKKYREKNVDKLKQKKNNWYMQNKEKVREYNKQYYRRSKNEG